jgi:PIN domain nuclease of toxin-antitoxin system
VNLLLDTHTLLWLMDGNPKLSGRAAALIADPANRMYLSMASIWELAIKLGLRKIGLSVPLDQFLTTAISGYGLNVLDVTRQNCVRYEQLSFPLDKHRDPFDRMIIVQAQQYLLSIVGNDCAFDAYGVQRLW